MRTRAKRKRVAEIKLQEVDDMYQILMPGRTMVGENAISMAKEQISQLGSHALIISGKIVEARDHVLSTCFSFFSFIC